MSDKTIQSDGGGIPRLDRPPKVLITKIGMDGHDRGSRIVATYLRDAGMEVVYTAPWQKIPEVVRISMDEDVDVIGISSLSSDHVLVPKLMEQLRVAGLGHVGVILGGTIPEDDDEWLMKSGVRYIARPGASSTEIVNAVNEITQDVRTQAGK